MPGILWPAISDQQGNILLSLLFQLEQSQWWPAERLRAAQFRQAHSLLRHAFESVPYYKKRLGEAGYDPEAALDEDRWHKLPLLKREDIQQAGKELWTRALPKSHGKTKKVTTSGSTGKPVELLATGLTSLFWNLFTVRDFFWRRCDLQGTLAAIRHVAAQAPGYPDGARMPNWGAGFASAVPTGPAHVLPIATPVAQQAEWLARQDADYLLTYPSNLEALMRHSAESGLSFPALREVETVSEMLPPHLRASCREQWGVPLVDMYTSQEAGYLALQCPEHAHYHAQAEHVILELLDADGKPCGAGETGRVVVTDLHNFATPLIRYDIGDYAEAGPPCDCGRGLPVLSRILGRARGMLTLPTGERRWPVLGDGQFNDIAPIRQYQFIQKSLQNIEIKLVTGEPLSPDQEGALTELIHAKLGHTFDLAFSYPDEIPRSASGKFEDFRSEIAT